MLLIEIREMAMADIALIVAFSLVLSGGLLGALHSPSTFVSYLPIVAVGVTLGFIVHELMHKLTAQRYRAHAAFKTSTMGLVITLGTSFFGFLVGIPGATYIYASNFTRKENGLVSLAGPMTNLAIFGIFLGLFFVLQPAPQSYLAEVISFTMFINLLLGFFNMLPIMPLDGSKVFQWNKIAYVLIMALLILLMYVFESSVLSVGTLLFLLVFAFIISMVYRRVL
jgi:Zn-dependent protease